MKDSKEFAAAVLLVMLKMLMQHYSKTEILRMLQRKRVKAMLDYLEEKDDND